MRAEKQVDLATVNLSKLRVPDLRKILDGWGEECRGCSEKSEFISLVKKLMPKYAPDAAAAHQARNEL